MKRRDLIKYTAMATGAAVCTPVLSTILSGCTSGGVENASNYQPKFFNTKELNLVLNLVDTILPKTDSPPASEVGVHKTIDNMVGVVYRPDEKKAFRDKFESLKNYLNDNSFIDLNAADKLSLLKGLDTSNESNVNKAKSGLLELKQQTIAYYLSTEVIAKNYLNYLPVPGVYEACISLDATDQKAWAI